MRSTKAANSSHVWTEILATSGRGSTMPRSRRRRVQAVTGLSAPEGAAGQIRAGRDDSRGADRRRGPNSPRSYARWNCSTLAASQGVGRRRNPVLLLPGKSAAAIQFFQKGLGVALVDLLQAGADLVLGAIANSFVRCALRTGGTIHADNEFLRHATDRTNWRYRQTRTHIPAFSEGRGIQPWHDPSTGSGGALRPPVIVQAERLRLGCDPPRVDACQ